MTFFGGVVTLLLQRHEGLNFKKTKLKHSPFLQASIFSLRKTPNIQASYVLQSAIHDVSREHMLDVEEYSAGAA